MTMRGRRVLGELDQQIRDHIERETHDNIELGMPPDEARYAALRKFGNVALAKEDARAVWVPVALDQLLQDLRFGCRILTRSPALSATAVLLVALVIGGNTTVFSIAHGILKKPAPGITTDRLLTLNWADQRGRRVNGTSYANYRDLAAESSTLRPMLGFELFVRTMSDVHVTLSDDNGSHALHGNLISRNYFETVGVSFVKGRGFTDEENELGSSGLVAVISRQAWNLYFQGAEGIVGHTVKLNGLPATIVGVVAPPFRGTLLGPAPDVWVPLVGYKRATGDDASLLKRLDGAPVTVNGRLAPGATLSQAQAEMAGLWARLQARHPELEQLRITVAPYSLTAGMGNFIDDRSDEFLVLFSLVTIMTLLIVCANVANLLLARAVIRQREMALRQALGASRLRLIRALLAEGLALSTAALFAACLFAWWSSRAVREYLTTSLPASGNDAVIWPDLTPDSTVLGYALVLAVLATVACTVAPTIRVWRQPPLPSLKSGEQGVIQGRSKLSNGLVVLQFALSVLLVTCAGLAYRSISMMGTSESGFDTRNLLLVTINTAASAGSPAANAVLIEAFREKLQTVPGVGHVSYFRAGGGTAEVKTDGSAEPERASRRHVGPGYLEALGVPLLEGRALSAQDRSRAIRSAVINRTLAEALWPGRPPVGRTLQINDENAEVVGVISDAPFGGARRESRGVVLLSAQQAPAAPGEMRLVIRHRGALDTVGPAVRRSLQQADAGTSIVSMRTWDGERANQMWPVTALTTLLVFFACGSLLIAGVGQYALVTFETRRRRREFGLRIALGASSRQVLTAVVRDGFRLSAVGLAIGFVLSLGTGRILGGLLVGITPTDPLTYGAVFGLLSVVSLLACYLPARRAARINPISALRED